MSLIPVSLRFLIILRRYGAELVSTIFSIIIIINLLLIFNKIPKENLLNTKLAKRFRFIGLTIVLSIIARYVLEETTEILIWSYLPMEGIKCRVGSDAINFDFFLIGLIFLVLAEIYYRVAKVQEDNALTI